MLDRMLGKIDADGNVVNESGEKVKFDVPKFFGIASHIYTKNSKFFPLVKAKSTHGYWSKYYTNDHTDNNYSELENATLTGGQNEYSIVARAHLLAVGA